MREDAVLMPEEGRLGAALVRLRREAGMSIDDVAREARIPQRLIRALEAGNLRVFSAKVYAQGACKRFVGACGAGDADMLVRVCAEEWAVAFPDAERGLPRGRLFVPPVSGTVRRRRIMVNPRLMGAGAAGAALILIGVFWGARLVAFVLPPGLVIEAPEDLAGFGTPVVTVSGRTAKESRLTVNGRELTLDERGAFHEDIELPQGAAELRFVSQNRFGKKQAAIRHIFIK